MSRSRRFSRLLLAGSVAAFTATTLVRRARRTRYPLLDKTVLITGGSRGLGLVLAREFLSRGARVAILARDQQELDRAAAELRNRSDEVFTVACDITQEREVEAAVMKVRQEFGSIHVLVNNAGTIGVGPFDTMTLDDYRESLGVHFWGPLYAILAALPDMRKHGGGRIVNISSIGGKISVPHLLPYCAGKFALAGLSEGLRAELIRESIYVTSVYPGLMRTGSPRNANFKGKHREEYAWFSVSGSLPGASISAERAARQIVNACERGDAILTIGFPAKVAIRLNGAFPGMISSLLCATDRVLPGPGGIGVQRAKGKDSASSISPSWITALNERAAERNNEVA